jgi:SAM-dependent methyltransferase
MKTNAPGDAPTLPEDDDTAWEQAVLPALLPRLPNDSPGAALVVQCRAGGAIAALQASAAPFSRVMAVDDDADRVVAARARVAGRTPRAHVALQSMATLTFGENVFVHAMAIHGLGTRGAVQQLLARCAGCVAPNGTIAVAAMAPPGLATWSEMMAEVSAADGSDGLVEDVHAALWGDDGSDALLETLGLEWLEQGACEVTIAAPDPDAYLRHAIVAAHLDAAWRPVAGHTRVEEAARRLRTYFAGHPVTDTVPVHWGIARVDDGFLDVRDDDVIGL